MRPNLVPVSLVAGALGVSVPARAEPQPIHIAYRAPAGCSSRQAFVAEVTTRTPRVLVLEGADALPTISVELEDRATGVVGELRLREVDGAETVRAVAGATCEEVVSALALIAAVLVDPEAMTRPETVAPAAPPAAASAPTRRPGRGLELRPSFGSGASLTSTVAPNSSYGPFLELGLEAERDGRRGPALSVALERFVTSTVSTPAGKADFSTLLGRVTLCPLRWPATGVAFFAPCAAGEAGALHVDVSDTVNGQEPTVLWLAFDAVLHLEVRPLRFLGVGLDVMGIFPAVRDDFHFKPGYPVFSVPTFGWTGRVGLKAVWP